MPGRQQQITEHSLLPISTPLDAAALRRDLAIRAPALTIECLDECPSTNTLLAERLAAHIEVPSGSVVACEHQTAGRGRRGRTWVSEGGTSLTFSLLWRFGDARSRGPAGLAGLSGLSLAVAVAVAQAREHMGFAGIALKWPNDLLHDGAKLGGILVEVNGPGTAIIGIGLNVQLSRGFAATLQRAVTDLAAMTEGRFVLPDRNALLAGLLAGLSAAMARYDREGFAPFRAAWQLRHAHQGLEVSLLRDDQSIAAEGVAIGVAEDGALLLRTAAGIERIHSGEVSLR
jgi:BirA family biotin operon repressor/biotin-[acetyl-CoA-carboxylase] ligase